MDPESEPITSEKEAALLAYRYNKVVWSEGMFLQPQHFQQHDRYIENLIRQCAAGLRSHGWGVTTLAIDADLLETGKFSLSACSGVLPDGTPFDSSEESTQPLALDLTEDVADSFIYLGVPILRAGSTEVDFDGAGDATTRFVARETEVRDNINSGTSTQIYVGEPRFRLLLEREERSGYQCIAVARVVQVSADQVIRLDEGFIAPCLDASITPLGGFLSELEGLLHQRGEALAGRVVETGRGGAAEIPDFLLLRVVNRAEPLISHLARTRLLHPEPLYRVLLALAGELATFSTQEKRPPSFAEYRHDALQETYAPLIASLRQSLSMVLEQRAIALPLEDRKFGIKVTTIADRNLLREAMFVLAVNADMPAETLRSAFPAQIKIGPVEKISDLVNLALPAVAIHPLPVAPRQIPFHAGVTYFELDTSSPLWQEVEQSGGLAFHVAGQFPNLDMAFWAIKR